jgi:molybdate transport system permease protein
VNRWSLRAEHAALAVLASILALFLATPLVALVVATPPTDLILGLKHPLVWPALRLSLVTTSVSAIVVVVLGTPLAWLLAVREGRVVRAVEAATQLPIVIPPAVAGVGMLLAFGRRGVFAGILYPGGWSVTFTTFAVVMAQVFVAAPFFLQAAVSAFRRVDTKLLLVARSFGATPFRVLTRVALPLAAPGLAAGAAMGWARALGEFGATLMFAGNLQGETQTLPLAIYAALESDMRAAQAVSVMLMVVAFLLLLSMRAVLRRSTGPREVSP